MEKACDRMHKQLAAVLHPTNDDDAGQKLKLTLNNKRFSNEILNLIQNLKLAFWEILVEFMHSQLNLVE